MGIEERTVVGVGVNGPPGVDVVAGPDLRPLHTRFDSRRRGEPRGRGEFGRQRSPSTELACDGSPRARRVRAARGGASRTTADGGREGGAGARDGGGGAAGWARLGLRAGGRAGVSGLSRLGLKVPIGTIGPSFFSQIYVIGPAFAMYKKKSRPGPPADQTLPSAPGCAHGISNFAECPTKALCKVFLFFCYF